MANTDAAFGLKPMRHRDGSPYNGASKRYYVGTGDANNIFIGDVVKLSGSGSTEGIPGIVQHTAGAGSSAGDGPVGVVVGFENLTSGNLSRTYRPASTAMYVLVADGPNLMFAVQEDSVGGALAVTDIGLNADIIIGTGNTLTGTSAFELDSSSAAVTATLDCRIHEVLQRPDNEVGANAIWLVSLNNHPWNVAEGE